ncbi:hypothetical protein NC653_013238 [Populus alba x Populus x berolinensis]|uniref:Uncharacterized protein n=1 Tax=Populus alba x Populus x berolinensis TaxID=444605 RepID=A0AAD6QTV1_9ROSI|nr:hypothetical protein NC653_013238 [Populus alba x Populus x berolinensis]
MTNLFVLYHSGYAERIHELISVSRELSNVDKSSLQRSWKCRNYFSEANYVEFFGVKVQMGYSGLDLEYSISTVYPPEKEVKWVRNCHWGSSKALTEAGGDLTGDFETRTEKMMHMIDSKGFLPQNSLAEFIQATHSYISEVIAASPNGDHNVLIAHCSTNSKGSKGIATVYQPYLTIKGHTVLAVAFLVISRTFVSDRIASLNGTTVKFVFGAGTSIFCSINRFTWRMKLLTGREGEVAILLYLYVALGELAHALRFLASVVSQSFLAFGDILELHKKFAALYGSNK